MYPSIGQLEKLTPTPRDSNREVFRSPQVIQEYTNPTLDNAETIILIKYRDEIHKKRVLDVGCGAGRTTFFLLHLDPDYVGIDYSPEMIATCRARFPGVPFAVCDFREMSALESDRFDCVLFSFNGIDYVGHEERIKGLSEIHRVLNRGGLFIFSSHNRNYRYAKSKPKPGFSLRPFRQWRLLKSFASELRNHRMNKKREISQDEYAVINDSAHSWSLLTYYIEKGKQIEQIKRLGFDVIDMYENSGNALTLESEDRNACWIYYVARKGP